MQVSLAHDYLKQKGGAEKVIDVLCNLYQDAPLFTLIYDKPSFPQFASRRVHTSFLQSAPLGLKKYQWYLPLMPTAVEHLTLVPTDVLISSTSAFIKGIITPPETLHVCYCHTPTRYLWSDTREYIEELRLPSWIKKMLPALFSWLRIWDVMSAQRVDVFIANSQTVARRIQHYYHRKSEVIYPPVETGRFFISAEQKKYFLTGGRLVSYKRFDLVIEAANKTGLPLIVFGDGPILDSLKAMAQKNVTFVGRVSDDEQAKLYANARAFIHQQDEDFGITAVESMASGRPVIAYKRGGATETVVDGVTGQFFEEQSWEELADLMIRFNEHMFDPIRIKSHAKQFSREQFEQHISTFVQKSWKQKQANPSFRIE